MIKKLFPFLSVIMLALFIGACNSEDVMPNIDQGASSRTVTFEGYMPTTTPSTRVVETPDGDRGYKYTWEVDDKLQLLFEQEAVEKTGVATVVAVDAKTGKGTFTLTLPEGIDGTKNYKLYGVINIDSNEYDVSSPTPAHIGILEDDLFVVFYFNKEVVSNEIGTVTFEHKTSIIEVEIKVTDASFDIGTLENIQLIGDDSSNTEWAYEYSGNYFDLKQGKFTDNNARTNSISYNDVVPRDRVLYGTFPIVDALGDTNWPALKLSFSDGTNTYTTVDAKPARTPEVGKAYYLYATWNGTDLVFADKDFNVPQTGTKISIADLRANYVADGTYAEDHFIEGEVVLNAEYGNVNASAAYVADETAGISFFFSYGDDVVTDAPLGAKVRINLEGATWDSYNGLIQLKSLSTSTAVEILEPTATTPLEPRVVTIQDLLDKKYQSELVQVNNVQFKDVPTTFGANPDLVDNNGKEINVRSAGGATFKGESVPEGNGPFIGVVGMFNSAQLHVRETADLDGMTGDRYVPPFIDVDPISLSFAKEAGSETIAVTANVAWTASSNAAWTTISPASGTNNGTITVNVEAHTGAEARSAIITITDGDVTTTVNVLQTGENEVFATDLFFSEYIEGSSNNKYLEIYNGTGATVDLKDYEVVLYSNGATERGNNIQLTGMLEDGSVLVIANSQADIYTGDVIESTVTYFNGDDAVALQKISSGDYVDIIGRIGEQTKWNEGGDLRTENRTLVRKPDVKGGVTVNPASGFPTLATEWIGYPIDTATYLGSHDTDY